MPPDVAMGEFVIVRFSIKKTGGTCIHHCLHRLRPQITIIESCHMKENTTMARVSHGRNMQARISDPWTEDLGWNCLLPWLRPLYDCIRERRTHFQEIPSKKRRRLDSGENRCYKRSRRHAPPVPVPRRWWNAEDARDSSKTMETFCSNGRDMDEAHELAFIQKEEELL